MTTMDPSDTERETMARWGFSWDAERGWVRTGLGRPAHEMDPLAPGEAADLADDLAAEEGVFDEPPAGEGR